MVQVVGKYQHESSEGLAEYLKAIGGDAHAEAAEAFVKSNPTFELVQNGDEYVLSVTNDGKTSTTTFKLGVPYDETMPHGAVLKSVTSRDGDKFTTETDLPDGNKSVRVYEFTASGIVVHLSDKRVGVKAVRHYKRL